MDNLIGVALDGVVVLLLSAAIVYGVILQRKLAALQSAQSDLAKLLGRLDAAISQASSTVNAFKSNTQAMETSVRSAAGTSSERAATASAPSATAADVESSLARRRKAVASLAGGGRIEAARELLAAMQAVRSA